VLVLLIGCGQAESVPLDLPPAPFPPPPPVAAPRDAGFLRDGSTEGARADLVPGIIDFGVIGTGYYADRTLMIVNRNEEDVTVEVRADLRAYIVLGDAPNVYVPANTVRELLIRFRPPTPGIYEENLTINACAGGCSTDVRLVGSSP
jgi:hypothetical protein